MDSFTRWHCTDPDTNQLDIGYACSSALGAPLLFGNPDRVAPCVVQNVNVQTAIRTFTLLLPALCFLLCCIPLKRMRITNEQHVDIVTQTEERRRGSTVSDPITHETLLCWNEVNRERMLTIEHFGKREQRIGHSQGVGTLKYFIGAKLLFWVMAIGGILAAMALAQGDAFIPVVTFGSLFMSLVLVLLPWDALKLRFLLNNVDIISKYLKADQITAHRKEMEHTGGGFSLPKRMSAKVKKVGRRISALFSSTVHDKVTGK